PKSSQNITWTDLGTSFIVSNVDAFSRVTHGSHFKHHNDSPFVHQRHMYGFHKINRTSHTYDSQAWEFSPHKCLRGKPDLLDGLKRKGIGLRYEAGGYVD
ncbi:hypothetical protein DL96DRAFT_1478631, partial [Flagelloscypha sp. PMI_526]